MATLYYRYSGKYFKSFIKNTGRYIKETISDAMFLRPFIDTGSTEKSLFSFDKTDGWGIGTDEDIGGYSRASLTISPDSSALLFKGNISLALSPGADAMYSGYAALRSRIPLRKHLFDGNTINCSRWTMVVMRMRGDYRIYNFNLKLANTLSGDLYSAKIKFKTPYEWEDVIVPFKYMKRTNCGIEYARQYEPNLEKVTSFGFLLADNLPGPFSLEIASMKLTNILPIVNTVDGTSEDVARINVETGNLVDKKPREEWKDSMENLLGFGFDLGSGRIESKERYFGDKYGPGSTSGRVDDSDWQFHLKPSGRPSTLNPNSNSKSSKSTGSRMMELSDENKK